MGSHRVFRTWCPLGADCKLRNAQLCKEATRERCVEKLMNHLTYSPSHKLDRTTAQEYTNAAEFEEEWVDDELVPETVQGEPVSKRARDGARLPTTPHETKATVATLHTAVNALTSAVSRMNPRVVPTYGDLERHRSTLQPVNDSGASGSGDSHVPWSDLQMVMDSVARAEAATKQAENISQTMATAFHAETLVLSSARDAMRIHVIHK